MANRLFNPDEQYCDQNGLPYAGGTLSFYASGTSTPLATYSNQALSTPNTNPVVLDSAGRMGSVFLQNLAYKVVLADVNANTIWTEDPVYSSDFSTTASILTNAGNPNGVVAGTAGSGTVPSSMIWDSTNNILYICTTTGNAASAVWTAVNATTAASVILQPQGYLTPTSGTPIITNDVTAATALLYTPYTGNLVPIYNGSTFVPTVFSELTLTLVASHAASQIYDVYVFNNSGAVTLVSGPAWSSATAGSCSRGSTAALTRLNGIWVNNLSITARNGSTTYTIGPNLATYVGSMFMDGTNGQISFYRSYGTNRKWAAWNYYNRANIYLKAGLAGGFNIGSQATFISWGSGATITVFCGLAEETFEIAADVSGQGANVSATGTAQTSIGWNSTSASSGEYGQATGAVSGTQVLASSMHASFKQVPSIGINNVNGIFLMATGNYIAGSSGESNNVISVLWRG